MTMRFVGSGPLLTHKTGRLNKLWHECVAYLLTQLNKQHTQRNYFKQGCKSYPVQTSGNLHTTTNKML